MSVTDRPPVTDARPPVPAARPRKWRIPWGRVLLVCAALLGSGAVRNWQDVRIRAALQRGMESPVQLEKLPMDFGEWKGQPTTIDANIVRGAGADQAVTRRYVNERTGVALDVILLFGPAVEMYIHNPELCYPKAGYAQVAGPESVPVVVTPGADASAPPAKSTDFRWLVYSKGEGAFLDLEEVVYAWRYEGNWTPVVRNQKHFERISGMYKVHVARRITPAEFAGHSATGRKAVANPCRSFLDQLVPEIEGRITARRPPSA